VLNRVGYPEPLGLNDPQSSQNWRRGYGENLLVFLHPEMPEQQVLEVSSSTAPELGAYGAPQLCGVGGPAWRPQKGSRKSTREVRPGAHRALWQQPPGFGQYARVSWTSKLCGGWDQPSTSCACLLSHHSSAARSIYTWTSNLETGASSP
jgi:hypothetical protein